MEDANGEEERNETNELKTGKYAAFYMCGKWELCEEFAIPRKQIISLYLQSSISFHKTWKIAHMYVHVSESAADMCGLPKMSIIYSIPPRDRGTD